MPPCAAQPIARVLTLSLVWHAGARPRRAEFPEFPATWRRNAILARIARGLPETVKDAVRICGLPETSAQNIRKRVREERARADAEKAQAGAAADLREAATATARAAAGNKRKLESSFGQHNLRKNVHQVDVINADNLAWKRAFGAAVKSATQEYAAKMNAGAQLLASSYYRCLAIYK
jgi:hypothetical protein